MKTCGEVMTRDVVTCVPEETVDKVAQMMKDHDIGPIPVVQDAKSKRLVGIVTDRDLVMNVLAEGRDAQKTKVGDVMTRKLVTCREDDSLKAAIRAMEDHQVRRIPVVNGRDEIVGIIAQADIATEDIRPRKAAELVEEISKPAKDDKV